MHLGRAWLRRPLPRVVLVAALAGALVSPFDAAPVAAAPAFSLEERAAAIASPSAVYVELRAEGYLRVKATGQLVEDKPVVVTRTCSGFVVGTDGYVATATRCVQPTLQSLRANAAYRVADDLVKDNKLTSSARSGYIQQLMDTTDFTVAEGSAAPVPAIYGQLYRATGGLTEKPAVPAKIVTGQVGTASETTLIKLAVGNLPVVQLDAAGLAVNTHVVQVAFGTNNDTAVPVVYTPRTRPSVLVAQFGTNSPPMYTMDGDLGDVAYGGAAVTGDGRVIGVITNDRRSRDQVNDLVTTADIRGALTAAGVRNDLGPADQAYRAGLDAFYAGHYAEAIRKFGTVLAAQPDQQVAAQFRDQARQHAAIEGAGDPGVPSWLLLVGASLAGVLLTAVVVLIVARIRRSRRRREEELRNAPDPFARRPSAPDPFGPVSGIPVSGSSYPVSGAGYPVSGGALHPVSGAAYPTSGAGYAYPPVSGQPSYPAPPGYPSAAASGYPLSGGYPAPPGYPPAGGPAPTGGQGPVPPGYGYPYQQPTAPAAAGQAIPAVSASAPPAADAPPFDAGRPAGSAPVGPPAVVSGQSAGSAQTQPVSGPVGSPALDGPAEGQASTSPAAGQPWAPPASAAGQPWAPPASAAGPAAGQPNWQPQGAQQPQATQPASAPTQWSGSDQATAAVAPTAWQSGAYPTVPPPVAAQAAPVGGQPSASGAPQSPYPSPPGSSGEDAAAPEPVRFPRWQAAAPVQLPHRAAAETPAATEPEDEPTTLRWAPPAGEPPPADGPTGDHPPGADPLH